MNKNEFELFTIMCKLVAGTFFIVKFEFKILNIPVAQALVPVLCFFGPLCFSIYKF